MVTALMDHRVHHVEMLILGFSLTVEWDPDTELGWDQHWQVWMNGPGFRQQLHAYPAFTDARRYLKATVARYEEKINEYRPLDV